MDGKVRLEREQGHRFVTDVVEAFPGEIDAISVAKPTLEDVFIHRTGHRFWTEQQAGRGGRSRRPEEEKEEEGEVVEEWRPLAPERRKTMATRTETFPAALPAGTSPGTITPALSLWWREVVRFYRNRSRVIGVIASPLLFWIVIGSGFGTSFRGDGGHGSQHYLDFFFPGALTMIVLFTAIFTMMSVIEDRNEGFLLSVLVAPVSRSVIVLGKVLGGTTLAAAKGYCS